MMDEREGVVEAELARHGTYASVTRGPSMRPLFKTHRDMVIIKTPTRPLKKYDVVVYTGAHNKYTMHRIIRVREEEFVIRGDNTFKREYVKKERVIGVLSEYNRKGRHSSVDSFGFKLYSRVWHYLYPLRLPVHKLHVICSRLFHKVFG